jgi:hypothetical protein
MKTKLMISAIVAMAVAAGAFAFNAAGVTVEPPNDNRDKKPASPTTPQVLMLDKLTYANKALDGLVVEDFRKIAESAEMMRMISRAASWYVIGSDEYKRYSKNFQEQAADLARHAKEKNLDAANLDYMRITFTCVQCHKHVRDVRSKEKP